MQKNRMKRLSLSRETLVHLEDERLQSAEGGAPSRGGVCCTATASCPPPSDTTC